MNTDTTDAVKLLTGGRYGRDDFLSLAAAGLFLLAVYGYTLYAGFVSPELIAAAIVGGYMALNIGANDVANNVGPSVGAGAVTLTGALLLAGIFEAAGALIAGGNVVGTIKSGIIDPSSINDSNAFIWLMIAALTAGAIWLNLATAIGAPVSTTHSIVGGVLGAGIAAGGWGVANWSAMSSIAASWVISPVLGGLIAAGFLWWIKRSITYKEDILGAGIKMVPIMVALMTWVFSSYLIVKGLKKIIKIELPIAVLIGAGIAILSYFIVKPLIERFAKSQENNKQAINGMFKIPLIFAAALLSFAHGANDVANAVGPLAAIAETISHGGGSTTKAPIPLWVSLIGALGIVVGLALFGPKLIRTVGSEITELDPMRAFCIGMSAGITVIVASQLGLPVSSTHIAVGGVFGVGFLREYLKVNYAKIVQEIREHHQDEEAHVADAFLEKFEAASMTQKRLMLKEMKREQKAKHIAPLTFSERKALRKLNKKELVKRSALFKIAAAWIITVPASAFLAAFVFFAIRGFMLP
ncbi:MAG: inorganic phosphate transporter [Gammaproteobacteria bacterium]|nr:inorganic phosphate transporter [Gammaproteobacteria bacterium]